MLRQRERIIEKELIIYQRKETIFNSIYKLFFQNSLNWLIVIVNGANELEKVLAFAKENSSDVTLLLLLLILIIWSEFHLFASCGLDYFFPKCCPALLHFFLAFEMFVKRLSQKRIWPFLTFTDYKKSKKLKYCHFFLKMAIPGPFLFIFVFSIQLTENECS